MVWSPELHIRVPLWGQWILHKHSFDKNLQDEIGTWWEWPFLLWRPRNHELYRVSAADCQVLRVILEHGACLSVLNMQRIWDACIYATQMSPVHQLYYEQYRRKCKCHGYSATSLRSNWCCQTHKRNACFCRSCTIDWVKGKNVTLKTIKKKQKHKGRGTVRTVTKTVPNDSFFNFFTPPEGKILDIP